MLIQVFEPNADLRRKLGKQSVSVDLLGTLVELLHLEEETVQDGAKVVLVLHLKIGRQHALHEDLDRPKQAAYDLARVAVCGLNLAHGVLDHCVAEVL